MPIHPLERLLCILTLAHGSACAREKPAARELAGSYTLRSLDDRVVPALRTRDSLPDAPPITRADSQRYGPTVPCADSVRGGTLELAGGAGASGDHEVPFTLVLGESWGCGDRPRAYEPDTIRGTYRASGDTLRFRREGHQSIGFLGISRGEKLEVQYSRQFADYAGREHRYMFVRDSAGARPRGERTGT